MTQRKKALLAKIPGDRFSWPIFGQMFSFMRDPFKLYESQQAKYGDIFRTRYMRSDTVTLMGAEANKFFLVEQGKYLKSKKGWDFSLADLFPNGLMLMDGERHKHHRSILRVAFKKQPMKGYLEIMTPIIETYLKKWEGKQELLAFPEIKELTLQIAGEVFFGLDFSKNVKKINKAIVNVVKAATALPFNLPFTTYNKGLKARKYLEAYFSKIITEKRQQPDKSLFSILCQAENEEGDRLTDKEIIDHLIFILMAGHDTTASTLTSLFYLLAKNPEWQAKLREENKTFLEKGALSFERLSELSLLDLAIKETLRMYPPLILLPRVTSKDLQWNDYVIPANTRLTLVLYYNHFRDTIWKNPNQFDPERFSKTRKEHQQCPHAYAPFGAGHHYCLGYSFAEMQLKVVLSQVLPHYQWSVAVDYEAPYRPIPLQEPMDGLPVQISRAE